MRNLMTSTDTKNATTQPIASVISSTLVKLKPNLTILISDSPIITGTARKKVNSAAATRDTPMVSAPIIVEPEREVPGMMESTWKSPMINAVL